MTRVQLTDLTNKTDVSLSENCRKCFDKVLTRNDLGFWQMPARESALGPCIEAARKMQKQFRNLVVIGIGGSSLGGRTLCSSLLPVDQRHRIHFVDHLDQVRLHEVCETLGDWNTTAWAIVSKSGRTMETLAAAKWFEDQFSAFEKANLFTPENCVVITELRANPLYDWAQARGVQTFEIPIDVGGRFSVLTPAGVFPYAFGGGDVAQLFGGARQAFNTTQTWIDLAAQSVASWQRDEWITLFWSYSPRLEDLGFWFQQLWAESLAKTHSRAGEKAARVSTPVPLVGPRDQHSILQQVAEGAKDKFVWFVRDNSAEQDNWTLVQNDFKQALDFMRNRGLGSLIAAEAKATADSLQENGVASLGLKLTDVTPGSLGEVLMGLQMTVAVLGEYININAFDQPGVERGKILAQKALQHS